MIWKIVGMVRKSSGSGSNIVVTSCSAVIITIIRQRDDSLVPYVSPWAEWEKIRDP